MINIPFNAAQDGTVTSVTQVGSQWNVVITYDDGSVGVFSLLDDVKVFPCSRVTFGQLVGYKYPPEGCDLCSVGLQMPSQFIVSNSPLTENGSLVVAWNDVPDKFYFGATNGGGQPIFRQISYNDLTNLPATSLSQYQVGVGNSLNQLSGSSALTFQDYILKIDAPSSGKGITINYPSGGFNSGILKFTASGTTTGSISSNGLGVNIYTSTAHTFSAGGDNVFFVENIDTTVGNNLVLNTASLFTTGTYEMLVRNVASGRVEKIAPIVGGITAVTADNGLTANTSTNVQLGSTSPTGSPFTADRYVYVSTHNLDFLGTGSGSTVAIQNQNATSGVGLDVTSDNGIGATIGTSNGTFGALISASPTSTNTIQGLLKVNRAVAGGTAANGVGGSIDYYLQHANGQADVSNQLISKWTDVTDATRVSQFSITGVNSAITNILLTLNGNGSAQLNKYGLGTFTGTAAYNLAVDATGNVIEVAAGGGGSTITFGTDNQIPFMNATNDDFEYSAGLTYNGNTLTVLPAPNNHAIIVGAQGSNSGYYLYHSGAPIIASVWGIGNSGNPVFISQNASLTVGAEGGTLSLYANGTNDINITPGGILNVNAQILNTSHATVPTHRLTIGGVSYYQWEYNVNAASFVSLQAPGGARVILGLGYAGVLTLDPDPIYSNSSITFELKRGTALLPFLKVGTTTQATHSIVLQNSVDQQCYLEYASTDFNIWTQNNLRATFNATGVQLKGTLKLSDTPSAYASGGYDTLIRNQTSGNVEKITMGIDTVLAVGQSLTANRTIGGAFNLAISAGTLSIGATAVQGAADLYVEKDNLGLGAFIKKVGDPSTSENSMALMGQRLISNAGVNFSGTNSVLGLYGELAFNNGTFTYSGTADYVSLAGLNAVVTMYAGTANLVSGNSMFSGGTYNINVSGSGNVDDFACIRAMHPVGTPSTSWAGTITNHYGVFIDNMKGSVHGATITNSYGLYQAGVNDLNVLAGNSSFGHTVTPTAILHVAAGTTAKAQMRFVNGVAPTTPNDGDVWFDGTDLKMRIGGVTKTFTLV